MRAIVLTNLAAGQGQADRLDSLERAVRAGGLDAPVRAVPGPELYHAARRALREGADAIVAAGGDGTVSAVAGAVVGTSTPLGVLPCGTLNHFAKDLKLPLDLAAAAAVIARGHTRAVDVGEVNDHYFVNNSSIGLYPHIVSERDEQRQRLGRGKWLAMAFAGVSVLRRYPLVHVVLETGGRAFHRVTPFVFIGNNRYDMTLLSLGTRQRLDGGELSLYFAHRTGRFGLLRLMGRALIGRLDQAEDFEVLTERELRIETRRKRIHVACDGEVLHLHPPLKYRTRPGALHVFVPGSE